MPQIIPPGKSCASYMLGSRTKATSLKQLSGGGISGGGTNKSALSGGSYEDAPGAPAAAAAAAPSGGGLTLEEVAKHTTKDDCWVVVNGDVLDVTKFLPDHPGGELAILTFAGKDASEEFNMIHPGDVISKYAPDAVIGKLAVGGAAPAAAAGGAAVAAAGGGVAKAGKPGGLAGMTLANLVEMLCCAPQGYYK